MDLNVSCIKFDMFTQYKFIHDDDEEGLSSFFYNFFFFIILLLSVDYFADAQIRISHICICVVSRLLVCVYSAYTSIFSISSYNLQHKWQKHNEIIWDIIGKRQLDLCVCIQLLYMLCCTRNRIDKCIVLFLLYCMDGHCTRMYTILSLFTTLINHTSTVIYSVPSIWLCAIKCHTAVW